MVLACVAAVVAVLGVVVTLALTPLVGLPLPVKILITVLLIFPAGFAMGMPFPGGPWRAWKIGTSRRCAGPGL